MTSSEKDILLLDSFEEAYYCMRDYRGVYETPTLETISNIEYNSDMGFVRYDYVDSNGIKRRFVYTKEYIEMIESKNPY